jgi:hypothetical protein
VLNSLLVLAAALCVSALLCVCILRLRRPRVVSRPAVFELADAADTERIRRQARDAVIAFGEELQDAPPSEGALDAYQAATMALDAATSLADLAGALVLVNIGRGGPPLCLFNPLHGPSAKPVTWRLLGSREQLRVPACAACAEAISRHRPPEVLPDTVHKKRVPYLDVDPGKSVWAATGFGVFSDDLVERILRGELRHRRPST